MCKPGLPNSRDEEIISGVKSLPEITCKKLLVLGAVTVDGKLGAEKVEISGTVTVEGNMFASQLSVSGKLVVFEDIEADQVIISNQIEVYGNAKIQHLIISGHGKFDSLECNSVRGTGLIETRNLSTQEIDSDVKTIRDDSPF